MLEIEKLKTHGFSCNCYLIKGEKGSIVIDPGERETLQSLRGEEVKYVLLTHGHFDHIRGARALQEAGAKIGCYSGEEEICRNYHLGEIFGDGPFPPFSVDFTFEEETLSLEGISISVISTPGHSRNEACYLIEDDKKYAPGALFTGDVLFCGSVGRTDGPFGSFETLKKSLKKLTDLKKDYLVFPGHGKETTLFFEKEHNGYLK